MRTWSGLSFDSTHCTATLQQSGSQPVADTNCSTFNSILCLLVERCLAALC